MRQARAPLAQSGRQLSPAFSLASLPRSGLIPTFAFHLRCASSTALHEFVTFQT